MYFDEYIKIEQVGGDLTSVVFMGHDSFEGLDVQGLIYQSNPGSEFNTKARRVEDLNNISEVVANVEGSWTDSCIIDDQKYWDKNGHKVTPNIPVSNPLPSDWRYREDLIWLWKGDNLEYAQNWKVALEDMQRKEAKLRSK